jgi:hypothetical protein
MHLVAALHQAPFRYAMALTGGGSMAAGYLLSVPGGSRTVLEVRVPYDEPALVEYIGRRPASFCSVPTAHDMAARAWQRAIWLDAGSPTAGVACTASLRSDRSKRGEHRVHIAVRTATLAGAWSLTLAKEQRERPGEEDLVDRLLLNAMAEGFGLSERVAVPLLGGEEIQCNVSRPTDLLATFLAGGLVAVCREPDGRLRDDRPRPTLVIAGSFNPLHEGHSLLSQVASRLTGRPAAFELCVANADKPPLPPHEVYRRLEQFTWHSPVWLTHAPTFPEKARLFPGAVFVVGADTAERVVQTRFYGESEQRMNDALGAFQAQGCRFLVACRVDSAGTVRCLDDLAIPPAWHRLFEGIPADAFRMDISSTQLRESAGR